MIRGVVYSRMDLYRENKRLQIKDDLIRQLSAYTATEIL